LAAQSSLTVLVVDDHPIFAEALAMAMRAVRPGTIIDQAHSLEEAAGLAARRPYAMIFLDLLMPDAKGFSGLIDLKTQRPDVPVAIISARHDDDTVGLAKVFGAVGYLPKAAAFDEFRILIGRLLDGEVVFPPVKGSTDVIEMGRQVAQLSPAQLRVLNILVDGLSNREIADKLNLTEYTVKSHMVAIFKALGVPNRSRAILAARQALAAPRAEDLDDIER
jgi:DNA-binding NarL/FixJ family response regulator